MPDRILVVDDEPAMREVLSRHLVNLGYEVFTAGAAQEALAVYEREQPRLALLDISMPGMTGTELAARLRNVDAELQIIFLTGEPRILSAQEAVRVRAFDYLTKPVDVGELDRRVGQALRERAILEECRAYKRDLESRYAELLALEQARLTLAKVVMKDLSDPLNSAANALDVLLSTSTEVCASPEEADLLKSVNESVQGAWQVVRRLSDLYLIGAGERHLDRTRVRLGELLAQDRSLEQGRLDLGGLPSDLEVYVDRGLFESALEALLEDLRSERPAAVVRVTGSVHFGSQGLRPAGAGLTWVRLRLEGPGPAVRREEISQLVDPLAGVGSAGGLALPFARTVLEVHGGSLEPGEPAPGVRAFELVLPRASEADA